MLIKIFRTDIKDKAALNRLPEREKWLFKNKLALKKVMRGLQDAAEGRLYKKGSFAKFVD